MTTTGLEVAESAHELEGVESWVRSMMSLGMPLESSARYVASHCTHANLEQTVTAGMMAYDASIRWRDRS